MKREQPSLHSAARPPQDIPRSRQGRALPGIEVQGQLSEKAEMGGRMSREGLTLE